MSSRSRMIALPVVMAFIVTAAGCVPPPTPVPLETRSIDAGLHYTCSVAQGLVSCWGNDSLGQLGDGTVASPLNSPTPATVVGITDAVAVSAGWDHACALRRSGRVACWGSDASGKLGDGTVGAPAANPTPTDVADLVQVVSVSAGSVHTCAARQDGSVWCWGNDAAGRLGDGTPEAPGDNSRPVRVLGVSDAVAVSVGGAHTCALRRAGEVSCWGYDADGQLGDSNAGAPNVVASAQPVVGLAGPATAVSAGETFTCVILTGGSVACWGSDMSGQLGDGSVESPGARATPMTVPGLSEVSSLSSGFTSACAVRTDRSAACWGYDGGGRLGDGVLGSPEFDPEPSPVIAIPPAREIATGVGQACARTANEPSAVWCWGDDSFGQLGDGTVGNPDFNPTPRMVMS